MSHARAGYASRRARRRWTAERFPVRSTWDGPVMAERDEPIAQLASRIPKDLHRRAKLYCVTHDIMLQHFVTEAISTDHDHHVWTARRHEFT